MNGQQIRDIAQILELLADCIEDVAKSRPERCYETLAIITKLIHDLETRAPE